MIVQLLTEHHFEFLSLTGGCSGLSESTLVKMSNCWKSHAAAHYFLMVMIFCFSGVTSGPSPSPDDDTFKHLALTFSKSHGTMSTSNCVGSNFVDGITNGAEWYSVYGMCSTVELWSLELACLEHQGSLELFCRSRQFHYIFNVKIHPRLEQRWLELKPHSTGRFFMLNAMMARTKYFFT